MLFRPFLYERTSCASYLFGCLGHSKLAVVDAHVDLVDAYLAAADAVGAPIAAVFETHIQADHVSGLSTLVAETGARAYRPEDLADGARVELGNTVVTVLATPGHAPAHHAYVVADKRRGTDEPWLVFTGDALLVGDVGRPDLHADGDALRLAERQFESMRRLLALPDHVLVYPTHYGGSLCGRALSANPFSTIGFERRHNRMLLHTDAEAFATALLADIPPPPPNQEAIVALNRA
jgi:hydroxyacylglutathione hydrolase